MTYEIQQYAADGHTELYRIHYAETIKEARRVARQLLGVSRLSRKWDGYTSDADEDAGRVCIEAYHESAKYGCGGVMIREQLPVAPVERDLRADRADYDVCF